jgi:short-subunit dehydrogenase
MRFLSLDPNRVARSAVAGMFRGKTIVIPGLWYKLNALLTSLVPRSVSSALSAASVKIKN